MNADVLVSFERSPVIAAIHDDRWDNAINSPVEVIIHLNLNIFSVKKYVEDAHIENLVPVIKIDKEITDSDINLKTVDLKNCVDTRQIISTLNQEFKQKVTEVL